MTGTGQGSAGSSTPFEPEAMTNPQQPEGLGTKAGIPSPIDEVSEMIDTAERLYDDPIEAWAAITAEIERRRHQRREWGSAGAEAQGRERVEPGRPGRSTGGAMSSDLNPTPKP